MTEFLTVEQVIALHDSEKFCAVIDRGKLESGVGQPQATWDGVYLYPTLLQQAAAYAYFVSKAHGFEDANKRAGWLSCVAFLEINGVELLDIPDREAADLMVDIVDHEWSLEQVTAWLADRT